MTRYPSRVTVEIEKNIDTYVAVRLLADQEMRVEWDQTGDFAPVVNSWLDSIPDHELIYLYSVFSFDGNILISYDGNRSIPK